MVKEDIAERVYDAHGGLTRREAATAVEAFLEEVREALRSGGKVKLSGFGVFRTARRKEKSGVHPKTGSRVSIKSRTTVVFAPSSKLLEALGDRG